jgi:hypothetical protein
VINFNFIGLHRAGRMGLEKTEGKNQTTHRGVVPNFSEMKGISQCLQFSLVCLWRKKRSSDGAARGTRGSTSY